MPLARQLFIFALLIGTASGAEVSNLSTADSFDTPKLYNLSFSTAFSTSLSTIDDPNKQISNEYLITPSFDLPFDTTGFAVLSGNKDLKGQRKFKLNDAAFGLSKVLREYGAFSISGKAIVTLPLSKESKKNQQLRTAIKLGPTLSYRFANGLQASYSPSIKLSFHKFKNAKSGASNKQYSLSNSASLSYGLFERLIIAASGSYSRSYTYRGTSQDSYGLSQSIVFLPTSNTDITIGHAIGGSPLDSNGIDTEIEIFNNRKSSVFAGFGYTY